MSWQDVSEFYASLKYPTPVNLEMRLLILTGSRSLLVRFAPIDEINCDIWSVPAEKMKGRKARWKRSGFP